MPQVKTFNNPSRPSPLVSIHGCLSFQIILEDIEQVVGQAQGAVAFAVFFHLGDHAPQGFSVDALFGGDLIFHFAQTAEFAQVGVHDDTFLPVDDARHAAPVVGVAGGLPHLLD